MITEENNLLEAYEERERKAKAEIDALGLDKKTDAIAFMWKYSAGDEESLEISNITEVMGDKILVHFLYGYKSMSEWIKPSEVVAIINENGTPFRITGWSGKVRKVLQKDLWNKLEEEYKARG